MKAFVLALALLFSVTNASAETSPTANLITQKQLILNAKLKQADAVIKAEKAKDIQILALSYQWGAALGSLKAISIGTQLDAAKADRKAMDAEVQALRAEVEALQAEIEALQAQAAAEAAANATTAPQ